MESEAQDYIKEQKSTCESANLNFVETDMELIAGVSKTLFTDQQPIHGLRHPIENGTCGWYLWSGEYSEAADFFEPHHAKHLFDKKPEVIKYLGLEPGSRFLIDNKGYEDLWFDKSLLDLNK